MKIGIQLFGVLYDQKTTVPEALSKLRSLGYAELEPCLCTEEIPGFSHVLWQPEEFASQADRMREAGFGLSSCHFMAAEPARKGDVLRELARRFSIRQYVVKSPQLLTEAGLQRASFDYRKLAEDLAESGVELLLHNEARDIETRVTGATAYERLLDLCAGDVGAQGDVGWAYAGGEDPVELLQRNAQRVRSIHFKDGILRDGAFAESAIGDGAVDIKACCRFAAERKLSAYVDQDGYAAGRWEDLERSIRAIEAFTGPKTDRAD